MKIKKFVTFAFVAFALATVFYACNEPEDELSDITVDLTEENRNFLFNTSAARSRARSNGIGGPAGFIFRLGSDVLKGGRAEKDTQSSPLMAMRAMMNKSSNTFGRSENEGDSTDFDLPDCFNEIFNENEDGSYEYILDFGTGCDVFGETLKGKLIETGSYSDGKFSASTTYEGFGSDFWEVNGTYNYDGTWDFPENEEDSLNFDFSAEYTYDYDLNESYVDGDESFAITSKGSGREKSDQNGYTVFEQENEFNYGSGESFSSKVNTPLFMDYDCGEDVFIFVGGLEVGSYTFEGETGTYEVNYGDGTCDNIISVTENGETFEIDLGDAYDDFDEDTDDD